jgi:hypothetical protein
MAAGRNPFARLSESKIALNTSPLQALRDGGDQLIRLEDSIIAPAWRKLRQSTCRRKTPSAGLGACWRNKKSASALMTTESGRRWAMGMDRSYRDDWTQPANGGL